MGVVLGIDCCLRRTSVGCVRDGQILGDIGLDLGRRQASLLPTVVEGLLRVLELGWGDLDAVALTVGPGYFTGVRVGLAYGTALADAVGLPVVPVGSLAALGAAVPPVEGTVVPTIWARHGAVYLGGYNGRTGEACFSPRMVEERELEDVLCSFPGPQWLVGSALDRFASWGEKRGIRRVESGISAATVALIGERCRGDARDPEAVRACYLRKPDMS